MEKIEGKHSSKLKKHNNFNIDFSMWNVLKEAMLKRKGLIEIGPRQPANYEFTSKF